MGSKQAHCVTHWLGRTISFVCTGLLLCGWVDIISLPGFGCKSFPECCHGHVLYFSFFQLSVTLLVIFVRCWTDGLRQLFTLQSLEPSSEWSGGEGAQSLVEHVMLSDTLLWKGKSLGGVIYHYSKHINPLHICKPFAVLCITNSTASAY